MDCEIACNNRTTCGSFEWGFKLRSRTQCWLKNINDQVVKDHNFKFWYSDDWYNKTTVSKSKSCGPYTLGESNLECDTYQLNHLNVYLPDSLRVQQIESSQVLGLYPEDCQRYCTLYEWCRSVLHIRFKPETLRWECALFATTLKEVLDTGESQWKQNNNTDFEYKSFARYCPDGRPYEKGRVVLPPMSTSAPPTKPMRWIESEPSKNEFIICIVFASFFGLAIVALIIGFVFYYLKTKKSPQQSVRTSYPPPGAQMQQAPVYESGLMKAP